MAPIIAQPRNATTASGTTGRKSTTRSPRADAQRHQVRREPSHLGVEFRVGQRPPLPAVALVDHRVLVAPADRSRADARRASPR